MIRETVVRSIEIDAPREKVWEVLLQDAYTRKWYEVFMPGSRAETDWQQGSKAFFKDNEGNGLAGHIAVNRPYEAISIQYEGTLEDNKITTDSEEAKRWIGAYETYTLKEKEGRTLLTVELEVPGDFYDYMMKTWDKALKMIKELTEEA